VNADRPCPFYKKVMGTNIVVDAFTYKHAPGTVFFLSHFHADHYRGLSKNFVEGHIYCSSITANLVILRLRIPSERIRIVPMNTAFTLPNKTVVTLLDANHCPGAVLFFFELPSGDVHLHSGDFRYCVEMKSYNTLLRRQVDVLYLDTTYCDPQYCFPPQGMIIDAIINAIRAETFNPKTLILIGTYTIGKEKILLRVAKEFGCKIYVEKSKFQIVSKLELGKDLALFTCNPLETHVHVVPLWTLTLKRMEQTKRRVRGRYSTIIGIQPTGWTFKQSAPLRGVASTKVGNGLLTRTSSGSCIIYGCPYSEHSSFLELRDFVRFIRPSKIVPTVVSGDYDGRKRQDMLRMLTA